MNLNSQEASLSSLSLANVETLAQESSRGSKNILITDMGTCPWDCRYGNMYFCKSYRQDCIGVGSLSCQAGTYNVYKYAGPCYETR